ncbi:TPA: hypothetical protein RQM98_003134 [Aeromonas salmonicida]|nr:hypothetical protein [Aeromonas salmonicida]
MKRYAVVCEGPSDFVLIKKITDELAIRNASEIEVLALSPSFDQTSSSWPAHGWGEVKNWCKKHAESKDERRLRDLPPAAAAALRRQTWGNLLRAGNLDGLILHIDTDIATEIRDCGVSFVRSQLSRSAFCKKALLTWLGIQGDPTQHPLHLITPTYSSEKWIISTYPDEEAIFAELSKPVVFEDIVNPAALMAQLNDIVTDSKEKVIKNPSLYEKYSNRITNNFERVLQKNKEIADLNARLFS